MKIKVMILSCLVGVLVLPVGYEYGQAESKAEKPSLKIGVVSIQKIFRDCDRSAKYRQETTAEQNKVIAELEKLSRDIEAGKAGLKTLKVGSSDHLALAKEILEKEAKLQAQREFHKQQMALKQHRMIEDIYRDILRGTREVAKEKGLDLVFEKSEPQLPASSTSELERTMGTHKLLYSGGCLDVTDDVMARVDAAVSGK